MSVSRFVRYPNLSTLSKFLNPNQGKVVQMRDDFLDAASHELKTPLTSLRLQVQLISRMAEKPEAAQVLPQKVRVLAEDADRQIERITYLIDSLLDASGIRAGKLELKLEDFDLAELVREQVSLFAADPAFAHLEIRLHSPQPIPGRWDRGRVAQVLKCLLSNAAQYGLRRPVDVTVWADRNDARISVRDQGIGIPEENHERIFEQFERCVSGDKFNGLGLGLYISRKIASAHGGSIGVESKAAEGSVFTLKLPLPVAGYHAFKARREEVARGSTRRRAPGSSSR